MKTILVPTDFSSSANAASKLAISLAKQFKSSVILLHVLEEVDEGSFNVEGEAIASGSWEDRLFNLKMIEKARRQLAQATATFEDQDVKVKSVLRLGDAYHGIQSIITSQKADLVVMGTQGVSGMDELVGSTAEKVVRRSGCPVISVNPRYVPGSFKSIVWATALRDEDLSIPILLRKLMDAEGTTVHLVRINTPGLFLSDSVAKAKLETYAKKMKLANYTINVYNDHDEESGITRFAASINADLIALSTHGRRGLAHLINGSVAEDVVNHAKRPVMTYVIGVNAKSSKKKAGMVLA